MPTRLADDKYLEHIEADSMRLHDVLTRLVGTEPVPTCPGWSADDLRSHLLEVQQFWAGVVGTPVLTLDDAQRLPEPQRPTDRSQLDAAARHATSELVTALRNTDSAAPAWSWSTEQSAGFSFRRQAHEACIHRVDAELSQAPDGSARSPIDAMLATDGVDEVLRIVYAERPEWAHFDPDANRIVRIVATDTGVTWLVTLGRLTGTDPADGTPLDETHIEVAQHDPGDGTVHPRAIFSGAAEDLYCRLWNRPPIGDLHRAGDLVLLAEFEAFLASADH